MNRKPLTIIAVSWLVVILIPLSIAAFHALQGLHIRQAYLLPGGFASASAFDNQSAVFSNGHELETYNYTNGQTTPLSQDVGLGITDTISTLSGRYVVFHDEQVNQDGSLAGQLSAQGADPAADYWWLFDTQGRTFLPLPQNTLLTKLYNGDLYALQYGNAGESVATYQLPGLQKITSVSVPGSSNFAETANGLLLATSSNKILLTRNGTVNQVLFNSATLVGVTADGQSAAVVTTRNGVRDLLLVNLQTNDTRTIAGHIANIPVWLSSGTVLYTDTKGNFFNYNLATEKTTQWKIEGVLAKSGVQNLKPAALIGPTAAVIGNGLNDYYLIGEGIAPVPSSMQ